MTTTLDRTERVTTVGGRMPLCYLQGGYGFDAAGRCLGRYSDQGEPLNEPIEAPTGETPRPEAPRPSVDHIRPKAGDETGDDLHAMTVLELRERCKAAGISITGLNKAALIEALEG